MVGVGGEGQFVQVGVFHSPDRLVLVGVKAELVQLQWGSLHSCSLVWGHRLVNTLVGGMVISSFS